MEIWSNLYYNADTVRIFGGGFVSCAIDIYTNKVYFRESDDGVTWTGIVDTTIVITDGPRSLRIYQDHINDSSQLVITNGAYIWRSLAYGAAGSWEVWA